MIASLQEKEKRLKSDRPCCTNRASSIIQVDADDPQKFNGDGLSISLGAKAESAVVGDSAIQMEIDAKQKEIDRIKYLADRRNIHRRMAPLYWRVNLREERSMALLPEDKRRSP